MRYHSNLLIENFILPPFLLSLFILLNSLIYFSYFSLLVFVSLLYIYIYIVWKEEQQKLILSLPAAQQARARQDLQQQETRYLISIERLRHMAREKNKEATVNAFFDEVSAPRTWVDGVYGKVNKMATVEIQRAMELKELYRGLQDTELLREERLATLQAISKTVRVRCAGATAFLLPFNC